MQVKKGVVFIDVSDYKMGPLPVHSIDPRSESASGAAFAVETLTEDTAHVAPHRHSFAQILFIERGEGANLIDFKKVPLRRGEIHVLAAGQVHAWELSGSFSARAAMFSEAALDAAGLLPDQLRELLLFGSAPITTSPETQRRFGGLLSALADAGSVEVGRHLALALLWECVHALHDQPLQRGDQEHSRVTRQFMNMAMRAPRASRTVAECAEELAVTPSYLTENLIQVVGSSPGQLLRVALTREAQRLLSGTNLTISQISNSLGFTSASYFSRFFRREVGYSPSEYRLMPHSHDSQK